MIKNDNPIKGIIKCGVCGQPYYIHKREDGKDKAYKCMSLKLKYEGKMKRRGSPSIGIDKLLDSLYDVASRDIITKLRSSKSKQTDETEIKLKIKEIEINNLKKEIIKFENKVKNLYEDYNERLITKTIYNGKKNDFEQVITKAQNQLDTLTLELKQLEDYKKKPIRDRYSKETFLREIKSVISQITISSIERNKKNGIDRVFSKNDVPVSVTVLSVNGDKLTYVLGRYSKRILYLVNDKFRLSTTLKPESFIGAYEVHYSFEQTIKKLITKKAA